MRLKPDQNKSSNEMAEFFGVSTGRQWHKYMSETEPRDIETAVRNLAIAFEYYNEKHSHRALKYRSPREFQRLMDSATFR